MSSPIQLDHSRDALLTDFGMATLRDRYLMPGETFQDLFARVASHYADSADHAQRIYDYMSKLWFMPATPVLSNGGTSRGLPISCFLNEASDSLGGILGLWNENVWLASKGGGIGSYWGNLRSIGEKVGDVGKTSGVIPFIRVMDSLTLAISQGSLRRGSAAVYLPISHPEIEEFIDMRRPTGGDPNRKTPNLHHGIQIPDAFMRAVEQDTLWDLCSPKDGAVIRQTSARGLWTRILTARIETGEPYLVFSDHVKRAQPAHHKMAGLQVKTSNLCVAPETPVLTSAGYRPIHKLALLGPIEVWNGEEWSETNVVQTAPAAQVLTVSLSDGSAIDCTPYHKFYIQNKYTEQAKKIAAGDLNVGDKLEKFSLPVVEGGAALSDAYLNGFFAAEGTYDRAGRPILWLYDRKRALLGELSCRAKSVVSNGASSNRDELRYSEGVLKAKTFVPLNYDVNSRLEWLAGLADGDGCVTRIGNTTTLQIASVNLKFMQETRLLLNTLGVQPKIRLMHNAQFRDTPDGHGGLKEYRCQDCYRLLITAYDLQRLLALGFKPRRLGPIDVRPLQREARQFVSVVNVEDKGRTCPTYCFTEPKRGKGVFNGVLTGNCAEITLPTGTDHHGKERTAVCCLSSLNLEYWPQWSKDPTFILDVMRFLDNVLQDFIDNAPDEMEKARYSAMRERSVGLGVMGFHSYLQSEGVPFESPIARLKNKEIFRHIRAHADAASYALASERGACPDAEEYGIMERFSHKMSLAPTASISIIAGSSSPGIEPIAANVFLQKTLSGSFSVRNRHLKKVLSAHHQDNEDVWSDITTHQGSVQHLDFLTAREKAIYRTAFELDQRWVVTHAADRAGCVCQSQSVNVFMPADIHKRDLHEIHFLAWKTGVKSLYYCRSLSVARAESGSSA